MGLLTVILVEKFKILGYGYQLPSRVRNVLYWNMKEQEYKMTKADYFKLYAQMLVAIWLIIGLAFHLAAVGLIGLSVIILLTNFTGKSEEHQIGKAFEESLPFTALLVVFFAVVGVIQENHLFKPIVDFALSQEGTNQLYAFFVASGILSSISDNVFVATIYIKEAVSAYHKGLIDLDQLNSLAIAINVGTNIPSVATPNGQAAFLFLLTSAISSRIKLSYLEMIKLALPYTIALTLISLAFVTIDWVPHHHIESKIMKMDSGTENKH
jgi:NhaB family Na+:H+ antiporter